MNVLITSVGRRNYIVEYFQQILRNKDRVFVVNSIENSAGVLCSAKSLTAPPIASDGYIPFLLEVCRTHAIGLLIPLFDLDLLKLASHKQEFAGLGTTVVVSDPNVVETTFDKLTFAEFLKSIDLLSPSGYSNNEAFRRLLKGRKVGFPLILKPRCGTGSIATQIVQNKDEFFFFIDYLAKRLDESYLKKVPSLSFANEMFIQQVVKGDEYHLDVINDLEGNYVTTFPKKKLGMRAGETDAAMTCDDEELIRIGEKLGRGLKHVGLLDVDLIKSQNGGYYVIDANPRFGGGYPFSHAAGANIPACLIRWARGKKARKKWLAIQPGIVSAKGFRIIASKNTSGI